VRWTRRPDGTWRRPERKRAGWVGDLEQKKYVSPGAAEAERLREQEGYSRGQVRIPGLAPAAADAQAALEAKGNKRNERKKEIRKEKAESREAERVAGAVSIHQPQAAGELDKQKEQQKTSNPKAIEKKLRQIVELEERQARGDTLNEDQISKIQSKESLEAELRALRISDSPSSATGGVAAEFVEAAAAVTVNGSGSGDAVQASAPPVVEQVAEEPPKPAASNKKAIEKKLRQIAELEERQARGEALNEDQLMKLQSKSQLEATLRAC